MTIYKQVPIEEELPPVSEDKFWWVGIVITSDGKSHSSHYRFRTGFEYLGKYKVTHWLKEITLPTEEEINKAADIAYPYSKEADSDHFYDEGFKDGVEYILTQLK